MKHIHLIGKIAVLLSMLLLFSCASAELAVREDAAPEAAPAATERPVSHVSNGTPSGVTPEIPDEGQWPVRNEQGFLDEGEFVYENNEIGVWRYCSATLRVEVIRRTATDPRKLIWYEAEVWSISEVWGNAQAVEGQHFSTSRWPYLVTAENGCVLAINGDYACGRFSMKNNKVGILIRDGKIYWSKTKKANYKGFPNLDCLAVYPDGRMEVYDSDEKTAQEYIDMGVSQVYSFGPWLIRDGAVNPDASRFGKENAPRTVIGMVETGHYWAIMLEGRWKQSKGASIQYMTNLLLSKGCTVGFNLDGGETACMCFMGKQISVAGGAKNKAGSARRESEFLSIGTSALV